MKTIVIYDFDHTLCQADSLKTLIYFTSTKAEILKIFFSVLYFRLNGKLDEYKREIIKRKFINLNNCPLKYEKWRRFLETKIDYLLISNHMRETKIVLSGSYKEIISPILDGLPGIDIYAAGLFENEKSYNAKLKKMFIIKNLKDRNHYLISYGDSIGDLQQIPLVNEFYLVTKHFGKLRLK